MILRVHGPCNLHVFPKFLKLPRKYAFPNNRASHEISDKTTIICTGMNTTEFLLCKHARFDIVNFFIENACTIKALRHACTMYLTHLFSNIITNKHLEKPHISILSTRNVICSFGGGGGDRRSVK